MVGVFSDKNLYKFEVILYSLLSCHFDYLIPLNVPNFTGTKSCEKGVIKLYSAIFVKTHSNMYFCTQKHMFFKFLHNLFMKEKKHCDLSPSQNWVAHLARWIFMNFSLSRSSSCTACSENTLTYTSWESFLNTGNLINDILQAIKKLNPNFSFWNIQSAPLVIYL